MVCVLDSISWRWDKAIQQDLVIQSMNDAILGIITVWHTNVYRMYHAIHRIEIYPVNTVIQPSNNPSQINCYPGDKCQPNILHYPLDRDLSRGYLRVYFFVTCLIFSCPLSWTFFPFNRMDSTLVDFSDMKWQRGDLTFIFNGDARGKCWVASLKSI